mmetsp:Transcript_21362/g.39914  ORF Transcript_21362/g.39914 Transcript_21362/m.39914 type:complete len:106 (-) Transcript_21362:121-438(-)|eukprot:CAMPEP_0197464230 /NCGR_PEP_ID=MMETSP1175-20131217/63904_1 /TAXON_ID=1003142 /ORGANISM="Triceratium dubium, Strain CCMP147" /LENGTH=105 /DNA_ID=CAMNT_0043000187 /DNA_START=114 /DNA_END=431 /DNA_ORIENTATION=+
MVKYIESQEEWSDLMEKSKTKLVVIDFTASWCGPCKFIAPHFEKMAEEQPGVIFVKIDVDEAEDLAAQCGIQAMPTFQFYKNGAKVDEMRGANLDGLKATVAKHA